MHRIVFVLFFWHMFFHADAQLSCNIAVGSQGNIFDFGNYKEPKIRFTSISPSIRYEAPHYFVRGGYKHGLASDGIIEVNTNSNGWYYMPGSISYKGLFLGVGGTYNSDDSRTKPYVFFEIQSYHCKFTPDKVLDSGNDFSVYDYNLDVTRSGNSLLFKQRGFRLGAGFQFALKNNFGFFYEATITKGLFYTSMVKLMFGLDAGVRYYIVNNSSKNKNHK